MYIYILIDWWTKFIQLGVHGIRKGFVLILTSILVFSIPIPDHMLSHQISTSQILPKLPSFSAVMVWSWRAERLEWLLTWATSRESVQPLVYQSSWGQGSPTRMSVAMHPRYVHVHVHVHVRILMLHVYQGFPTHYSQISHLLLYPSCVHRYMY